MIMIYFFIKNNTNVIFIADRVSIKLDRFCPIAEPEVIS